MDSRWSLGDLTARARIRDAAMRSFAEVGVAGTTMRAVAVAAGVSTALVQHHFGTKAGLREACDAFVLDYYRSAVKQALVDGKVADAEFVRGVQREAEPLARYLARALVDGSPAAAAVFDELVGVTEQYLLGRGRAASGGYAGDDLRDQAVVLTAMRLGVTVLHAHVSRLFGVDVFSADGGFRAGRASLDLLAPELLDDGVAETARQALPAPSTRQKRAWRGGGR